MHRTKVKLELTLWIHILTAFCASGQADTVFIKYNKDKFEEALNYATDTVLFETPNARQILYGTTVLPWTNGQQVAKNFGIVLHSVTSTDCVESGKPTLNEILTIEENDTTLTIEIKLWANCCHAFLCDLDILENSIINLQYFGYGATYCACDCCYGITYNMKKWNFDDYQTLKNAVINGDRRTIKKLK